MSLADIPITAVGHLERAGTSRSGHEIAAIVVVADERPAVIAVADYQHAATSLLPHFYLARDGTLAQLLTINRAGDGLGRAIWRGRMRNLNRIAVIVSVEAPNVTDLSEVQASVLADWLPALVAQSHLSLADVCTVVPDDAGRMRLQPYLPPSPPVWSVAGNLVLGSGTRSPEQELWVALATVTWRQRGAQLRLNQAFSLYWGNSTLVRR
ncbi:hypothetical protein QTO31_10345 [Chloroflexus sp. MS-CIW-1]|uniref:hypothetical protein n=1 Tax=Chloroflexus sp. MS-CIW-1 TaxID=3055768 RepID=UPI0026495E6C|nr:hypothetical protein [Chloroflexus sp. MS-CIW-1]MDN5272369.1 hypothetical protein [Chloroflexus sp. MS-CIW-1]